MKYIYCTSTSVSGQAFPVVMLLKSKLCLMRAFSFFLSNSALSSLVVVREAGFSLLEDDISNNSSCHFGATFFLPPLPMPVVMLVKNEVARADASHRTSTAN